MKARKHLGARAHKISAALCGLAWAVGCAAPARAAALDDRDAFIADYRAWLDQARTPVAAVGFASAHASGWVAVDHTSGAPVRREPGARLVFVNRGRSALFVVVGRDALTSAGMGLIVAHIDTPSPRIDLGELATQRDGAPLVARAQRYGGIKSHHWLHTPLAMVGRVAVSGPREIDVALGLEGDDFAFYATRMAGSGGAFEIVLGSVPSAPGAGEASAAQATSAPGAGARDASWLFTELERRYGVHRRDLVAAELFLVPRARAREVGLDRELIGAHGQDDRANSYIAWRAITSLEGVPERTVAVWLVDREEAGSHHVAGAESRFLEAALAYLVRAQGARVTESVLGRIFGLSQAISADTPSALNPNFPEVHEIKNAPVVGRGAALFPYTGSEGKDGGNAAHAALIRSAIQAFERAGQPLQHGTLGRVDEGGGGTVARYLAERGVDVVDIGVAGISLHSPMELFAKDDIFSGYLGFRAWLAAQ